MFGQPLELSMLGLELSRLRLGLCVFALQYSYSRCAMVAEDRCAMVVEDRAHLMISLLHLRRKVNNDILDFQTGAYVADSGWHMWVYDRG